jgi:ankyrin repeat protein
MKAKITLLIAAVLLVTANTVQGQQSVCDLFSNLDGADGHQLVISGDLIISKNVAVLGAGDCDNRYISHSYQWPTALTLLPSAKITPEQLQQFQSAKVEADRLRREGKTVHASASFSGRLRIAESGGFPAELTFDSFENLKIEALPDPDTLTVIPICDLFHNLPAWKGKRIAVRGAYVSTMEGAWIVGDCKGGFVTDGYRWPVSLNYAIPSYYSQKTAYLYETKWPSLLKETPEDKFNLLTTATFVGILRMRSEYTAFCRPDRRYMANGFGHLNGAAAELIVDRIVNVEVTSRPDASNPKNTDTDEAAEQRCTPPDLATLCSKADSLVSAASIGCADRVREFLTKDGIDSKNGSESMSLRVAIHSGNESVVRLLLDAGAPVDPVGATEPPLVEAALFRQPGVMKLLLASGAKIESIGNQKISLQADSKFFDPNVIEVILDAGADVDAANALGETALMKASAYGFEQTIKVLIAHKSDVNRKDNKGRTALMHAAATCCSNATPVLLENGADPNIRDNEGKTALDLADGSNNLAAFAILSVATKRSH